MRGQEGDRKSIKGRQEGAMGQEGDEEMRE